MTVRPGLKVVVLTMVFPAPSEAFAGVEVRALRALGARVAVRALRGRHVLCGELLQDWSLGDLDLSHAGLRSVGQSLRFLLWHPRMSLGSLGWLLRRTWRTPLHAIKSLMLWPRCLEIFAECVVQPPDVLHLFWGHYPSIVGDLAERWLPGTHVSISLGAYDLLTGFAPSIDIAARADSLWTHAQCNLPALAEAGVDTSRVRVLARGIDVDRIPPERTKSEGPSIVTVARLETNKGTDDVLRAFAAVHTQYPAARLEVIGEGPQRPQLETLANELGIAGKVVFRGAVGHSAVLETLARSRVFMLLSRNPSERLPNSVKEAMACECACIITRTPGIDELAVAWASPRIVAQADWPSAAGHLREILARPDAGVSERAAARRFVVEQFDSRRVACTRLAAWGAREPDQCAG